MTDTPDTSGEAVERLIDLLVNGFVPPEIEEGQVPATLRSLVRERDGYRAQLEKVTSVEYLADALEKIGVVDADAAKAGLDELLAERDAAVAAHGTAARLAADTADRLGEMRAERDAAIARAEAAEAKLSEAMSLNRAATAFLAKRGLFAEFEAWRVTPGMLDQSSD